MMMIIVFYCFVVDMMLHHVHHDLQTYSVLYMFVCYAYRLCKIANHVCHELLNYDYVYKNDKKKEHKHARMHAHVCMYVYVHVCAYIHYYFSFSHVVSEATPVIVWIP